MSTAAAPRQDFTPELKQQIAAWLSHPDSHIELLDGRLAPKSMAKLKHGGAQGAISAQVFHLLGPAPTEGGTQGPGGGQGRWWLGMEVDVYIGGEGMRPDVVGWRIDRHPTAPEEVNVGDHLGVIVTPPDWVCEVLSKSTSARDRGIKWKAYQRAGVEWYWIVDLPGGTLTVYERTTRSYEVVEMAGPGDVMRLPPFEGVEFVLAPLFVYCMDSAIQQPTTQT